MIEISPQERALLGAIASTESPGYNVMYGHSWSGEDRTFSDFSDHPRKFWPILSGPNKGKKSSAAGRYQFLGSTWDTVASRYKLPDFRPEHQDMGAVALARENYARVTGRNLTRDLASGDAAILANIGKVLAKTWTSLPSGIEEGQDEDRFVSTFSRLLTGETDNPAISARMASASSQAGSSAMDELTTFLMAKETGSAGEGEPPLGGGPPASKSEIEDRPSSPYSTGRGRFSSVLLPA